MGYFILRSGADTAREAPDKRGVNCVSGKCSQQHHFSKWDNHCWEAARWVRPDYEAPLSYYGSLTKPRPPLLVQGKTALSGRLGLVGGSTLHFRPAAPRVDCVPACPAGEGRAVAAASRPGG